MAKLETTALGIADVKIIRPFKQGDARGFFSETYNLREFAAAGLELPFVQDNHSLSARAGTVRGLHYQSSPFAQDKLVRVVRGRIFDVALDIRTQLPQIRPARHGGNQRRSLEPGLRSRRASRMAS